MDKHIAPDQIENFSSYCTPIGKMQYSDYTDNSNKKEPIAQHIGISMY